MIDLQAVERYLERNYCAPTTLQSPFGESIKTEVENLQAPFSQALLQLIDQKGMQDVAVYKCAGIDRKLFSKIRSSRDYMPSKQTALALALALRLDLDETHDLLSRAGYALSHASKSDVIIEYCIRKGIWEREAVNEVLYAFAEPLLGK